MGGGAEKQAEGAPDHCPAQPQMHASAPAAAAASQAAAEHPAPATAAAAAGAPPPARPLAVPHFQQAYSWDCGLACVLMTLRALGMRHHTMATLMRLCPTRSIWTIDLAHLLAACGARVRMLTITLGVNQVYCGERFYAETMRADSARVNELFRTAAAAGVEVQQRSLPLADLTALVAGGAHLVLALVDKSTLASASASTSAAAAAAAAMHAREGPRTGSGSSGGGASGAAAGHYYQQPPAGQEQQGRQQPSAGQQQVQGQQVQQQPAGQQQQGQEQAAPAGYLGHYVLLVGYDAAADAFEYRDPAMGRPRLWVPAFRLEAARKRFGTDEDLLLVSCCCGAGAGGSAAAAEPPAAAGGEARPNQQQQQQLEPGGAAAVAAGAP